MKTLELNQMEQIEGGGALTCATFGASGAAIVIGAAEVLAFTGPIGWGVAALGLSIFAFGAALYEYGDDPCAS
ncbi:hypothetical protein [Mesoflavibacter sp. CH_XMU1422-2]|uniref:hypothetical protein n=1 Tax=Mesoflavibacter sp. CH_XMU1422-2 TaxID=3107770 RepID=UPI003008A9BE